MSPRSAQILRPQHIGSDMGCRRAETVDRVAVEMSTFDPMLAFKAPTDVGRSMWVSPHFAGVLGPLLKDTNVNWVVIA